MFHCVTAILFRWGVFNPRNNDTLPKSSPRHFTMKYIWVFFKNWGRKNLIALSSSFNEDQSFGYYMIPNVFFIALW